MKNSGSYHRRATECLSFASNARNEEERSQLLIMARTLEQLALKSEKKSEEPRKTHSRNTR